MKVRGSALPKAYNYYQLGRLPWPVLKGRLHRWADEIVEELIRV